MVSEYKIGYYFPEVIFMNWWKEIEWGSVADWFGATGTIAAVVVALWQASTRNQIKYKSGIKITKANALEVAFFNNSQFDSKIQAWGIKVYKHRFGSKKAQPTLLSDIEQVPPDKSVIIKSRSYERFRNTYYKAFSPEIKYVYVQPAILDTSGKWQYPGRRKKIKRTALKCPNQL
jgi:hypothetical protein